MRASSKTDRHISVLSATGLDWGVKTELGKIVQGEISPQLSAFSDYPNEFYVNRIYPVRVIDYVLYNNIV